MNWLSLGDENSKFFHRFLLAKKRRNLISELVNEQGQITTSFKKIEEIILRFYNSLYTKSPGVRVLPTNLNWPAVNNDKKKLLISRFTLEEVRRALKMLGKNKAPGPVGFTVEFFPKILGKIKKQPIECF